MDYVKRNGKNFETEYDNCTGKQAKIDLKKSLHEVEMRNDAPFGLKDLVQRMLVANPKERITLTEIMHHEAFEEIDWREFKVLEKPLANPKKPAPKKKQPPKK